MALTWSIGNVANYQELLDDPVEAKRTEALVFATMFAGIGEITEKNADEFFARVNAFEKLNGPLYYGPKQEDGSRQDGITREMVRRRVGLVTNASAMTRAQWVKHHGNNALDETLRRLEALDREEARKAQKGVAA